MSTSDELRTTVRRSRQRVEHVHHLVAEQRLIRAESTRRLAESRLLLDRAFVRAQVPSPAARVPSVAVVVGPH